MADFAQAAAMTAGATLAGWLATNAIALFAVPSGLWAVATWLRDQHWKRIGIALERIASFDATPGTHNAMMILKSRSRPIPLFDPSAPLADRYSIVTWDAARRALVPTRYNHDGSPKANALRDCFEDLMNRMTQIEMYVAAGRLSVDEVRDIVEPWARRLDGTVDDGGLTRNFRIYLWLEHKYAVIRLFRRFDNRMTIRPAEWSAFCGEIGIDPRDCPATPRRA